MNAKEKMDELRGTWYDCEYVKVSLKLENGKRETCYLKGAKPSKLLGFRCISGERVKRDGTAWKQKTTSLETIDATLILKIETMQVNAFYGTRREGELAELGRFPEAAKEGKR